MSENNNILEWDDFWAYMKMASKKRQLHAAKQLDLAHWLKSRSGSVQVEVLLGAPEAVIQSLYKHRAIPRSTVFMLAKKGKNAEKMGLGIKYAT